MRLAHFIAIFFLLSCSDHEEARQLYINKAVDDKVHAYKVKKKKECYQDLLKLVNIDVDSIMLLEAGNKSIEGLEIPLKKFRPARPTDSLPKFEKPIKPKVDSLIKDTIIRF